MKRDFRSAMILLAFSLPVIAALFIGSIYFANCGVNNDCARGDLAAVIHTPIPTLLPATLPAPTLGRYLTPTFTELPSPTSAGQANDLTPTVESVDEVPEPSNPGAPGPAVNLVGDATAGAALFKTNCASCHGDQGVGGVPNPGSDDGTVPPLNPIDPLLVDPNYATFASNIDLFIQHGSVPEGPSPWRNMPGWGDNDALTQQQIADLIAYVISLNK
ncbi:MAG TPA: cytochrome c [Anaerolineales bacterium]|nr:cytochrome c [Anaerolineales bacterium]